MLHPIEIKRTANPGAELVRPFKLLDKASVPRGKGAIYENIVGEIFIKQGCDLHFYRNEKVTLGDGFLREGFGFSCAC